ncbi:MAG: SDR family oxidoreductase [Psychromonas sp.]|nr:SDR family oxidoreductase [Psychromonas sp.]
MVTKKASSVAEIESKMQLNSRLQICPIAIIGMASVFAETKNLEQFWDNIVQSVNGIKDVPENRWAIDDYYSNDKRDEDKTYCKRGGFLPEMDFDPMAFGLPPNILELTDVAQLMSLVVARDVLADAGLADESTYDRDKMGIILGVGGKQQQMTPLACRLQGPVLDKVLKASGVNENDRTIIIEKFKKAYIPWEENSFPGMLGNVIAGRIANRFDLGGTNCVVDAACAGSLAAIKMAVSELLEYRSETMITGGVCCDNSPFLYMSFSKTPAFTDGDDIRPFDEDSQGMMIGEGVGMMVLKRLEDAQRDGDRIYSVIKGIGSSSDGRFKSIYAPHPRGQLKALKRAYQDAGFDPLTCDLIEGHGTGTKAGDAAEFSALNMLFSENNAQKQHIALGSIKSQVGHTKAAAGAAGMIKASLALYHKVLPATINIDKPNLALDIENSPLYVNNETRPWLPRADGVKRRAGISSFGFGGTNFHFVLEEYQVTQTGQYRLNEVAQTILISEKDKTSLMSTLSDWENKLNCAPDEQQYVFNALVLENPLKTPKVSLSRCGFVAKNATQAVIYIKQILDQLNKNPAASWSIPTGIFYRESGLDTRGKVVALFSGQGAQYVNMGRDLTCNFPSMLSASAKMDKQFSDAGLLQLSKTVFPIPVFEAKKRQHQDETLRLTQYAQPAIAVFSAGLFNTFKQAGFTADFSAGHSFGELTALWAAEVITFDNYMLLARGRGQAMMAPNNRHFDAGTMAAVVGSPDKIAVDIKHIKDVSIANYNANDQVVIAGPMAKMNVAFDELCAKGYKVVMLPVSAAFHTPLVAHAQKAFSDMIDSVHFHSPTLPVFANGTAKVHALEAYKIKASLKNHMLESVHFNQEINNLYAAGGRIFIEFGPKNTLTRFVDNILKDKNDVVTIAVNANPKKSADLQLRLAAVEMAVLGLELDNIDPYSAQQRPLVCDKKSPLSMKLSGASVVSKKTKQAFTDALNDGFTISPEIKIVEKEVVKEVIVKKTVEKIGYVNPNTQQGVMREEANNTSLSHSIERCVAQIVDHQSALLAVHKEFMQEPIAYADTLQAVLGAQANPQILSESLDKTLAMYHDFQSETIRVHETYLNNQNQSMQKILSLLSEDMTLAPISPQAETASVDTMQVTTAPVLVNAIKPLVVANTRTGESPAMNLAMIHDVMMSVVSDKTGYPVQMLELTMDMEADLGIDSIKRVEILGAIQDEITDLPALDPIDLAELRTLGEILDHMQAKTSALTPVNLTADVAPNVAPIVDSSLLNASSGNDFAKIQGVMMSVVSDKTGYPVQMLELTMDMEADLGIDSIKRVEILGAIQDEITDLPELDPIDLAELRTLGEIVNYIQGRRDVQGRRDASFGIIKNPALGTVDLDPNVGINKDFSPLTSATVFVKYLAPVTKQQTSINGENLLLVDDGANSATDLAQKLIKQGWYVTVIKPSWVKKITSMGFSNKVKVIRISSLDEDELKVMIAKKSHWTSVVYLHPKTSVSGIEYPSASKKGVQLAFLLAKLTALAKNTRGIRSSFVVLTRQGGAFGVENNEKNTDLVQAGLSGLVKTLSREWPSVFCRVLDVSKTFGAAKVANLLFDEINDVQKLPVEVGFYKNKRLTISTQKTDSYALKSSNSINKNSLFLVSGGARGVTAYCVIRLAQTYKSKFILLGRSEYKNTEPAWANGIDDEFALKKAAMDFFSTSANKVTPLAINHCILSVIRNREIAQTMNAITKAGSLVEYVSVDITDREKVKARVTSITNHWGNITGLIHGAGILADKFIEKKTLADFECVYRPKMDGLLSMLSCCQNDKLEHFVLFSSLAGFFGNPGQSDYAIANDILNKTAFRFKALHQGVQVLSFNWGPWDGGMVTATIKRMFTDRGVYMISPHVGAQLLVNELSATSNRCPQILVGAIMSFDNELKNTSVNRLTKKLSAANNPFFVDHQINGQQVLPTVCAIAWMVEACHKTYPDHAYLGFENYKLLKGVIFDGSQAEQLDIDLNLIVETAEKLQIEVKISCVNRAGKATFNYVANLFLAKHKTKQPVFNGKLGPLQSVKHCLYEDQTLFHGGSLQGIIAINECDEQGLLLSCQIDDAVKAVQGEFDVQVNNIFANDLVYQALIVWARKKLGLSNLPTATLSWQVWQEVPVDQPFYLKLNVTENRNNKLSADVLFIGHDKKIFAKISGVQAIIKERVNAALVKADKII